jgi:hypothetical protein
VFSGSGPNRRSPKTTRHARSKQPTPAPPVTDVGDTPAQAGRRRFARRAIAATGIAALLVLVVASPAYAAGAPTTLNAVVSNLTDWLVGILAGVATLFLTIGGLRYLTAGGDPVQVEKAKSALKSAAVGYALAVLAPLVVTILASVVGG